MPIWKRAYFGQADVKETDLSTVQDLEPLQLRLARNFQLATLESDGDAMEQLLSA